MGRTRLRGLEIAGVRIALERPDSLPWEWPTDGLRAFACEPVDPEVTIGVRVGSARLPRADSTVYATADSTFEVARDGGDWVAAFHGRRRYERVARFDATLSQGEVVIAPGSAAAGECPLAHPLDELILLHRLARAQGLILQGSAVLRDSRALVFVGRSEAPDEACGSERWQAQRPSRAPASERVALRIRDGEVRVYGTPWSPSAEWRHPISARIDAIHAIQPARAVYAERLEGAAATAELLAHVFAPIHDEHAAEGWMRVASHITRRAPVLRLGMPREPRVVPFTWGERHAALAFAPPFVR